MENRLREFWEHMNDDEYWQYNKVPAWEFWANRIILDAEDTSIFVHDIKLVDGRKNSDRRLCKNNRSFARCIPLGQVLMMERLSYLDDHIND